MTELPAGPRQRRLLPLDAMRGVAALLVVAFHFSDHVGGWHPRFGYLAVDLFFVLSGFVIAHAYDRRFAEGMTVIGFMQRRTKRLAPLFILGWLIGVVALFAVPDPQLRGAKLVATIFLNAIGFPSPFPASGSFSLFGVNRPFWSLFFEFWVANLGLAIFWRWLRGPVLYALVGLSAVSLILVERHFHSLAVGTSPDSFLAGFPRVTFSFFIGVLIARFHAVARAPYAVPTVFCLAATALLLSLPVHGRIGEAYELGCVFVLLPALVYIGASARETGSWLSTILGDLSYAAYTIHFPLVLVVAVFAPAALRMHGRGFEALFVLAIGIAALAAAAADARFRRWLDRRGRMGARTGKRTTLATDVGGTASS